MRHFWPAWTIVTMAALAACTGSPPAGGGGGGGGVALGSACFVKGNATCVGAQPAACVELPGSASMTWQANGALCTGGTFCQVDSTGKWAACVAGNFGGSDAGTSGSDGSAGGGSSGGGADAGSGGGGTDAGGSGGGSGGGGNPMLQEALACLQTSCPTEVAGCKNDVACNATWTCLGACPDCDLQCMSKCAMALGETNAANNKLSTCADKTTCGQKMVCAECGNGKCEPGETPTSCAKDCAGGGGPVCGNGQCEPGENPANCSKDCASSGPMCGNGKCEPGESSTNCAIDCGSAVAKCGNGKCDAGESTANCALDCSSKYQAQVACMASVCSAEWAGCMADPMCMAFLNCGVGCNCDDKCENQCAQMFSGNPPESLLAISKCEAAESCPESCPSTGGGGGGGGSAPGCSAIDGSKGGCGGCACEAAVCAVDEYCCPPEKGGKGWDSICAEACGKETPGYCQ